MNKTELIKNVAEVTGKTQKETREVVESVLEAMAETLAEGEEVNIHGFGKFKVVERPARQGRNPKTGEAIEIPARNALKFKPASRLKEAVQ